MSNQFISGALLSMFFNTDFPIVNAANQIDKCNIYNNDTFIYVSILCIVFAIVILIISFGKNK